MIPSTMIRFPSPQHNTPTNMLHCGDGVLGLSFPKHQQLVSNHSIVSSDQKTWYSMHHLLQVVFSILQSGLKCLFCRSGVLVCSLKVRSRAGFQ